MKHIKKKFLNEIPLPPNIIQESDGMYNTPNGKGVLTSDLNELSNSKLLKTHDVILITEDNVGISTFTATLNGTTYIIPEADPVLIYFHSAQSLLKDIENSRKEFVKNFSTNAMLTHNSNNFFYSFFGNCSNFIIMLYTALEAFVNKKNTRKI